MRCILHLNIKLISKKRMQNNKIYKFGLVSYKVLNFKKITLKSNRKLLKTSKMNSFLLKKYLNHRKRILFSEE
jgi:hypothetical protein